MSGLRFVKAIQLGPLQVRIKLGRNQQEIKVKQTKPFFRGPRGFGFAYAYAGSAESYRAEKPLNGNILLFARRLSSSKHYNIGINPIDEIHRDRKKVEGQLKKLRTTVRELAFSGNKLPDNFPKTLEQCVNLFIELDYLKEAQEFLLELVDRRETAFQENTYILKQISNIASLLDSKENIEKLRAEALAKMNGIVRSDPFEKDEVPSVPGQASSNVSLPKEAADAPIITYDPLELNDAFFKGIKKKDLTEQVKILSAVQAQYPDNFGYALKLAEAYNMKGAIKRSMFKDSNDFKPIENIARIMLKGGEFYEAQVLLKTLLTMNPLSNEFARQNLGLIEMALGNRFAAMNWIKSMPGVTYIDSIDLSYYNLDEKLTEQISSLGLTFEKILIAQKFSKPIFTYKDHKTMAYIPIKGSIYYITISNDTRTIVSISALCPIKNVTA
jgi:hypothetical protein